MDDKNAHLNTLNDIKQMMERSSRFISLSGLSGVGAGICGLAGAYFASREIAAWSGGNTVYEGYRTPGDANDLLRTKLLLIGVVTFVSALIVAFLFTYIRSIRTATPLWGATARRLLWNTFLPIAVGGVFIQALVNSGAVQLVAPACLLFYGLGLINGSKYTLTEIRWLGYCELVLGIVNLLHIGYGIYYWAIGFGALHIVYGIAMWWKYERKG